MSDSVVGVASKISISSLSVSVCILVLLLSLMNGFYHALITHVLGLSAHVYLVTHERNTLEILEQDYPQSWKSEVLGFAKVKKDDVLIQYHSLIKGVKVFGITSEYASVSNLSQHLTSLDALNLSKEDILLGYELAQELGVSIGDEVILHFSQANITPLGLMPRLDTFVVKDIFDTQSFFDQRKIFIHYDQLRLLQGSYPSKKEIHIKLKDPTLSRTLLQEDFYRNKLWEAYDWNIEQGALFRIIQLQKRVIVVLFICLVFLSAFNISYFLMLWVRSNRREIAVLKTIGCSNQGLVALMTVLGVSYGAMGVLLGGFFGVIFSLLFPSLYEFSQRFFDFEFINQYFVHYIPSYVIFDELGYLFLIILSVLASIAFFASLFFVRPLSMETLRNV